MNYAPPTIGRVPNQEPFVDLMKPVWGEALVGGSPAPRVRGREGGRGRRGARDRQRDTETRIDTETKTKTKRQRDRQTDRQKDPLPSGASLIKSFVCPRRERLGMKLPRMTWRGRTRL